MTDGDDTRAKLAAMKAPMGGKLTRAVTREQIMARASLRLEKFVNRADVNQCWEWLGVRDRYGYGRFEILPFRYGSHKWAWMVANDADVPEGLEVRHTCDNPPCCNPAHLIIGTHRENMLDIARHGRNGNQVRGEAHPDAKLTEADVIGMREMRSRGATHREIAERYGVTIGHAGNVLARRVWRHVA